MITEQELRSILDAEVADFEPSPVGWDLIQRRVAGGRRRFVLRRALPVVAGLAVLVILSVLVVPNLRSGGDRVVPNPPTASSPAPSTTAQRPTYALWPFTVMSEVRAWEGGETEEHPYASSPDKTASFFASNYVKFSNVQTAKATDDGSGIIGYDASLDGSVIARLEVRDLSTDGAPGPYAVLRAYVLEDVGGGGQGFAVKHDPKEVVSPPEVTFTGLALDADEAAAAGSTVQVSLRDGAGDELSSRPATLGDNAWRATLPVPRTSSPAGGVVAVVRDKHGAVHAIAAEPVLFAEPPPSGAPTASAAPPAEVPKVFVAEHEGRINVYRTADGSVVQTLVTSTPGSISDVSLDPPGKQVVFAKTAGTCAAGIHQVGRSGGTVRELVESTRGRASAPAFDGSHQLAYALARCVDGAESDRVDLVLRSVDGDQFSDQVIDTATGPGADFRSTSWSVDGQRLAAIVGDGRQPGGSTEIRIYQPGSSQHAVVLPRDGCGFTAVAWDGAADGGRRLITGQYCDTAGEEREARVYVAYSEEDGSAIGLSTAPLLTHGGIPITTLDLDPNGEHVLLGQTIRNRGIEVSRWDFDGNPVYITVPPNLISPAW